MPKLRKTLETVIFRVINMSEVSTMPSSVVSVVPAAPTEEQLTVIGKDSSSPIPMIERVWDTFSQKGVRTVFLVLGNSSSCIADLEMAESLGCPINCVPIGEQQVNEWKEVALILKERKRTEAAQFPFTDGAQGKWVLPKNIRIQESLPWWCTGSVEVDGLSVKTESAVSFMQRVCKDMKIKDGDVRLDILKIDLPAGLERACIPSILDAGFRPALIVVKWQKMPDVDLSTTLAAGHLQNSGYRLLKIIGRQFLYLFTNNDMYQLCSWENMVVANPLLNELIESAKEQFLSPTKIEVDGNTAETNLSTC